MPQVGQVGQRNLPRTRTTRSRHRLTSGRVRTRVWKKLHVDTRLSARFPPGPDAPPMPRRCTVPCQPTCRSISAARRCQPQLAHRTSLAGYANPRVPPFSSATNFALCRLTVSSSATLPLCGYPPRRSACSTAPSACSAPAGGTAPAACCRSCTAGTPGMEGGRQTWCERTTRVGAFRRGAWTSLGE